MSHRELDPDLSTAYRPYHTHTNPQPLQPGEVVETDVEVLPTSIVVPAGYQLALSVYGRDYRNETLESDDRAEIASFKNRFTGCGPFIHDDPQNRPESVFGGTTTVHLGPDRPARVLVPIVPEPSE